MRHVRDRITMADEEIAQLLAECTTVQVASINRDGSPHLVPMFFVVPDGRVTFWTYRSSQKVANLRRDPRLACLVETGTRTEVVRAAQLNGTATISEDPDVVQAVGEALHARYVGPVDDDARADVRRRGGKRVVVTVEPARVVSWDHRKLTGGGR